MGASERARDLSRRAHSDGIRLVAASMAAGADGQQEILRELFAEPERARLALMALAEVFGQRIRVEASRRGCVPEVLLAELLDVVSRAG